MCLNFSKMCLRNVNIFLLIYLISGKNSVWEIIVIFLQMCLNFCKNVSEKCQYFPGNLSHFKNISLRNDSYFSLNVSEFSSEYVWEMSVFFWKDFWLYKKNWVWEIIVIFLLMCPSFYQYVPEKCRYFSANVSDFLSKLVWKTLFISTNEILMFILEMSVIFLIKTAFILMYSKATNNRGAGIIGRGGTFAKQI